MASPLPEKTAFQRAASILRRSGPKVLGTHAIQAAGLHRKLIVIGGWNALMPAGAQIGIHCGQLESSELNEYLALRKDQSRDLVEKRLERGEACLIARHEGRVVGANWCATRSTWIDYLSAELHLAHDTVYAYDSFVDPNCRGKRVADGMRRFRMHWIDQAGYRRAIGLIWPQNANSMHRNRRMSRNIIGELHHFRAGLWTQSVSRLQGEHADICHF
ncbi:MAG: hypothetical protein CBC48_16950 [bacterium TMED88]|nr:hypothetical protein [Deltaproteobacteria bacterium]OUV24976.1 MAG: hypothetical protein CBC48_16950 [bacterium TMED88]